jgi:amino acid adenylation domain-containing protein
MQEVMYARALYGTTAGVDVEHVDVDCPLGIDVDRLQAAMRHWVQEFEVLRTSFTNLEVVQVVHDTAEIPVEIVDLTGEEPENLESRITRIREDSASRRFELTRPPLARVILCQLNGGGCRLIITIHHLLYDGRCAAELIGGLFDVYDGISRPSPEEARRPSTGDFAKAVRALDPEKSKPFFENLLKGFSGPIDLRLAAPATPLTSEAPAVGYVVLPVKVEQIDALKRSADRMGVTVNTLLQVAWATLLARYSGTLDVVWGTTRAARHGVMENADQVVGMCINTVPCRLVADGNKTLAEAAAEMRRQHVEIRPHEHTSMAHIRKWCGSGDSSSLFTTLILFENFLFEGKVTKRISATVSRQVRIFARPGFDLTVMLCAGEAPQIELVYERATVRDDVAKRVAAHIQTMLASIARAPLGATLGSLAHIPEVRKSTILRQARGPQSSYPRDCTITQLFEKQVDARPDAVCLKDDTRAYTYRQVEQWSNRFASVLRQRGVECGVYVPILMERSLEYVIAALGVLKAGATYVPLDVAAPAARLEHMVNVTSPRLVITTTTSHARLPATQTEKLLFDQLDLSEANWDRVSWKSSDIANVIFTSGSTGIPKGVMLPHRSVVHLTHNSYLPFAPDDVYLFLSSVAFDTSNLEMWSPLLSGATLAISPDGPFDFDQIRRRIRRHGVTRLWLTSTLFNAVVDADPELLRGLKTLIAGGEVLSPAHMRRAIEFSPATHFVNGYGPTECSTFTTTNPVPKVSATQSSIPIGRPLDHAVAITLDIHGQPVDTGFAGELFIAGDGMSLGYLGDESLTASKFDMLSPFGTPERFYRSGDLVRLLDEGELDFVARMDQQVKLRGYRIDLGEIEAAVMKFPRVARCAVLVRGKNADKHLLLCVVPATGEIETGALRAHLRQLVPEYMVPRDIHNVAQLPVTINGKLDRPALEKLIGNSQPAMSPSQQPADDIERAILKVFSSVLGAQDLPVDVGLVGLGFNSLSIVDLSLRLKRDFGARCPNLTLTGNPSARDLARIVRGDPINAGAKPRLLVPMPSSGGAAPMFIVPGIWGDPFEMRYLAKAVGQDRPVFTLRAHGLGPQEEPRSTIPEIAADYASALEEAYPEGPVHLMGYSFGATVAYELVQQLLARRRKVRFLGLIDSPTVRYLTSRRRILMNRLSRLAEQPDRIFTIISEKLLPLLRISEPKIVPNIAALSPFEAGKSNFDEQLEYKEDPAGIRVARRLAKMLCMPALKQIQPVIRGNLLAYARYKPPRYDGSNPVHLFACEGTIQHESLDMGWRKVVGQRLQVWTFPGQHNTAVGVLQSDAIAGIVRGILSDRSSGNAGVRTLTI